MVNAGERRSTPDSGHVDQPICMCEVKGLLGFMDIKRKERWRILKFKDDKWSPSYTLHLCLPLFALSPCNDPLTLASCFSTKISLGFGSFNKDQIHKLCFHLCPPHLALHFFASPPSIHPFWPIYTPSLHMDVSRLFPLSFCKLVVVVQVIEGVVIVWGFYQSHTHFTSPHSLLILHTSSLFFIDCVDQYGVDGVLLILGPINTILEALSYLSSFSHSYSS